MMSLGLFWSDEAGAVAVDWVVLSAAVVGLGLGSVVAVRGGMVDLGSDIWSSLSGAQVAAILSDAGQGGTSGGPFTWTPLFFSNFDDMVASHYSSWSDADIQDIYDANLQDAWFFMNAGNYNTAAALLDEAAALRIVGDSRGLTLTTSGHSFDAVYNRYREAVP